MPRAARLALATVVLLAAATPSAAHSPMVDFIDVVASQSASGWHFEVELEGTDVSSIFLDPPGSAPLILLTCQPDAGGVSCDYEDPPSSGPGFPSLAALLAEYPAGTYGLSVDSELSAALDFAPVEPDGRVLLTSPANAATQVGATPSLDYTHDCTNCVELLFELSSIGPQPPVQLEAYVLGAPPASPGSVPYALLESYGDPKPAALPDGHYQVLTGAAVGTTSMQNFDQGGSFEYTTGAVRERRTIFTVPEPSSSAAAAVTALSLLAAARRRRRRDRASSTTSSRSRPRDPAGGPLHARPPSS